MDADQLPQLLRDRGHRATRPRRAVFEALLDDHGHLTVEELAERVHSRQPSVNLASVYRSLALFEELGLARETRLGDEGAGRWELAHPDEHFHLVCVECGNIDHHQGTLVEQVREHLAGGHGFQAETVDLTVTGRCADCAGHTSPEPLTSPRPATGRP